MPPAKGPATSHRKGQKTRHGEEERPGTAPPTSRVHVQQHDCTITDPANVIAWASSGHVGFKGSRTILLRPAGRGERRLQGPRPRGAQGRRVRQGPAQPRDRGSLQAAGPGGGRDLDVTPQPQLTVSGLAPARLEKMARYTGPVTRKSFVAHRPRRWRPGLQKVPTRRPTVAARIMSEYLLQRRRSRRPVSHTANGKAVPLPLRRGRAAFGKTVKNCRRSSKAGWTTSSTVPGWRAPGGWLASWSATGI